MSIGPETQKVILSDSQIVLDSVRPPAGDCPMLRGHGPDSFATATAQTQHQSPAALVTTKNFAAERMSQWQGGTTLDGAVPAVLAPRLTDLTLCGYDPDASDYTTAGVVNHDPAAWDQGKPSLYSLACIRGSGAEIHNVRFFYCPGIACIVARDVNQNKGFAKPFDFEVTTIENCKFSRVYAGLWAKLVDAVIINCEARAWRDYAFRLHSGTKASHLHCYGGGAQGIWLESDRNQLAVSYSENCQVGLDVTGNSNLVTNLHYKECRKCDVRSTGTNNRFAVATHEAARLGYLVGNQDTSIRDATIDLLDGGTAVRILNGTRQSITGVTVHAWNRTGIAAVSVAHPLNGCEIDLRIVGGSGVGVDLSQPGMLGSGNSIRMWVEHFHGEPLRLPPQWGHWNHLTVNGQRVG